MPSFFDDPENIRLIEQGIDDRNGQRTINRFNAQSIFEAVTSRVIGQDVLAARVARLIEDNSFARRREKPFASVLISGPTGTGKTEFAKALTAALFPDQKDALERIDCGNLGSGPGSLTALIGAGAVYTGSSRGTLPEFLKRNPKGGVILFDELEKAIPQKDAPLAKILLALLDEGRVQSQFDNSTYSASQHVIVMTSNAKQAELGAISERYLSDLEVSSAENVPDLSEMDELVKQELSDVFAPEFLGRLDLVSSVRKFRPIERVKILEILLLELAGSYDVEICKQESSMRGFYIEGEEKFGQSNVRGAKSWVQSVCGSEFVRFRKELVLSGKASGEVYPACATWSDKEGSISLSLYGSDE